MTKKKDPGFMTKDPGFMTKDPGFMTKDPGFMTKAVFITVAKLVDKECPSSVGSN